MAKTAKTTRAVVYRHTSHAEWGLGVIVEENPRKVYLAFEDGGRRPFVNVQRYREQFVAAELSADAAEAIVAKIAKSAAKPTAKTTEKKAKKKAVAVREEVGEEVGEDDEDHGPEDAE